MPADLSAREREILLLAAGGQTDKEIAKDLSLSIASIRTYWERLRQKLNANNKAHAIGLALLDIVKEQEREQYERDELIKMIVENSTDYAIFAMNLNCKMITWNVGVERVFGYSEEEFLKLETGDIFTPEDRAAGVPEGECNRAAQEGRAQDERWHLRKDGSVFYGSGIMIGLRKPDGELRGYGKIVRDYTGLKLLIERNQKASSGETSPGD